MAEHLITLAIEVDPGQGDPAKWDWLALTDSPYPVGVVAGVEALAEEHPATALRRLAHRLLTAADHLEHEEDIR